MHHSGGCGQAILAPSSAHREVIHATHAPGAPPTAEVKVVGTPAEASGDGAGDSLAAAAPLDDRYADLGTPALCEVSRGRVGGWDGLRGQAQAFVSYQFARQWGVFAGVGFSG